MKVIVTGRCYHPDVSSSHIPLEQDERFYCVEMDGEEEESNFSLKTIHCAYCHWSLATGKCMPKVPKWLWNRTDDDKQLYIDFSNKSFDDLIAIHASLKKSDPTASIAAAILWENGYAVNHSGEWVK